MKKHLSAVLTCVCLLAFPMTAFAGQWKLDHIGWWYQNDNSSYPADCWQWIDGNNDGIAECYYFDQTGYLLTNTTTPDQYQVNADGAWIVNGAVQVKQLGNTVNNPSVDSNCFKDLSTYFASDFRSYDIINSQISIDDTTWSLGWEGLKFVDGQTLFMKTKLYNLIEGYTLTYDTIQSGSPLINIEGKVDRFFNGVPSEDDYPADELARIAKAAGAEVELEREKREVRNLWDSQGNAIASKSRWIENVHVTIYYNGYQYKYSSGELTSKYVTVTKY